MISPIARSPSLSKAFLHKSERICYDRRTNDHYTRRLWMLKFVQTVGVQVSDQDKAIQFYVNALGFEKTMDAPMDATSRWVVVTPPGAQTGIVLSKGFGPAAQEKFTGYIFSTDDLDATYATLRDRGVE